MTGKYHRPHKWNWFLSKPAYMLFMIRELTAVFIGAYLILLLIMLAKLGGGEATFCEWLVVLRSPLWMGLHFIALVASLWHSITWFNLTPRAMPFFIGEKRLADPLVATAMGYGPWLVISLVILWGVLR